MIGLMPFTGAGESFPVARKWSFNSTANNGTTFTANLNTTSGKLYVMMGVGSDSGTYMNNPSGWTQVSQSQNTTFHTILGDGTTKSIVVGKTGSGYIATPLLFEVSNFKSRVPTYGNANVYSGVTSISVPMVLPDKNSLILGGLWLAASRTVSVLASAGAPVPEFLEDATILTFKSYKVEKVPAGTYTMTASWTSATNARLHLISIR